MAAEYAAGHSSQVQSDPKIFPISQHLSQLFHLQALTFGKLSPKQHGR